MESYGSTPFPGSNSYRIVNGKRVYAGVRRDGSPVCVRRDGSPVHFYAGVYAGIICSAPASLQERGFTCKLKTCNELYRVLR